MRRLLLLVGAGIVAACSSFGSNDTATPGTGDGGTDGGVDEAGNPITGEPADNSFILTLTPSNVQVIQGASAKIEIAVKRGKQLTAPIDVRSRACRRVSPSAPSRSWGIAVSSRWTSRQPRCRARSAA